MARKGCYKLVYFPAIAIFLVSMFLRDNTEEGDDPLPSTTEDSQENRLALHREVCRRRQGLLPPHDRVTRKDFPLVYVPRHNFSYCMISKTGTTSMLHALGYIVLPPKEDRVKGDSWGIQQAVKSKQIQKPCRH